MAPEQLEGREADARADIFAFGAVLYEMIAGRRAFGGTSPASIIGAVLKDEPPPLRERQASDASSAGAGRATVPGKRSRAPVRLRARRRSRAARDRGRSSSRARGADCRASHSPTCRHRVSGGRACRPHRDRHRIAVPRRSACRTGPRPLPGHGSRRLAHRQSRALAGRATDGPLGSTGQRTAEPTSLWVRALDSEIARELPGTAGATYPFWSPDSQAIAFFAEGKLKRVDVAGGTPIVICDAENPRGGAWNQDGVIIFSPTPISPLLRVSASGGVPAALTPLAAPRDESPLAPFPPRWRSLSLLRICGGGRERQRAARRLSVQAWRAGSRSRYDGGPIRRRAPVLRAGRCAARAALRSRQACPSGRAPGGRVEPRSLATGNYSFSVSRSGTLAYYARTASPGAATRLTWLARNGRALGTIGDTGNYTFPSIAPDQNRVTVTRAENDAADIFTFEGPAWTAARLTTNPLLDHRLDLVTGRPPDRVRIRRRLGCRHESGAGACRRRRGSDRGACRPVPADSGWMGARRADCVSGVRQPGPLEPLDEGRRRPPRPPLRSRMTPSTTAMARRHRMAAGSPTCPMSPDDSRSTSTAFPRRAASGRCRERRRPRAALAPRRWRALLRVGGQQAHGGRGNDPGPGLRSASVVPLAGTGFGRLPFWRKTLRCRARRPLPGGGGREGGACRHAVGDRVPQRDGCPASARWKVGGDRGSGIGDRFPEGLRRAG